MKFSSVISAFEVSNCDFQAFIQINYSFVKLKIWQDRDQKTKGRVYVRSAARFKGDLEAVHQKKDKNRSVEVRFVFIAHLSFCFENVDDVDVGTRFDH